MSSKWIVAGVCAVMTLVGAPASAGAQPSEPPEQVRLTTSPDLVGPGRRITVHVSHCPGGPDGPVTSSGFAAPITLTESFEGYYGIGNVTSTEGSYPATLRCKGVPAPGVVTFGIGYSDLPWSLGPAEVEPSGTMIIGYVATGGTSGCDTHVISSGFVAPIEFISGHSGASGRGPAITTPGTYQAFFTCGEKTAIKSFTILGTPPTAAPVKPKVVKPVGAPQTGGGGTS